MARSTDTALAAGLRPEAEVLLCCARTRLEPDVAARARTLIDQNLDWASLLGMAERHRVVPLLHANLSGELAERVPLPALQRLRRHAWQNAASAALRTESLLDLLRLFDSHGIPAIPFKGPALAVMAYGSLTLREFSDLDIMVRVGDVGQARALLATRGYRLRHENENPRTPWQAAEYLRAQYNYSMGAGEARPVVELHWRFTPRYFSFALDPAEMWSRAVPLELGGATVLSFAPEDVLLSLCAHGTKHRWRRLAWICDIAELLRRQAGDWEAALARARALGGERMALLGMLLARELLGAPVPAPIARRMDGARAIRSLAADVRHELFDLPEDRLDTEPLFQVFHLRARERLHDRVGYCLRWATTPTWKEQEILPLPAALEFLYYPLRPIRLVSKGLKAALRRQR